MAFFLSLDPLPIEHLAASPYVLSLTVNFPIIILALVDIAIAKPLISEAMALVVGPLAFIYPLGCVGNDSLAISFGVHDLAAVH